MTQVETMYGVLHNCATSPLLPSFELIENLEKLEAGTVVGIETFDPNEYNSEGFAVGRGSHRRSYRTQGREYWNYLENNCRDFGHQVVYLDDFTTYKAHAERVNEAISITNRGKRWKKRYEKTHLNPDPDFVEERLKQYRESAHRDQVEARYIFEILREGKILDNILKYQPRVVILGQGHGDMFVLEPEILASRGITVGQYIREIGDLKTLNMKYFSYGEPTPTHNILEAVSSPDTDYQTARESMLRQRRAVNEGRVMSEGVPDYIGTWDLQVPSRGLFELYFEDGSDTEGVIEDTYGTAYFEGSFSDNLIYFRKIYDESKSSPDSYNVPLFYQGVPRGDHFEGEFRREHTSVGLFRMQRFQKG